ncbi:MAG: hypothetical protein ACR2MK_02125 [Solirubrobacteraceae bacterium]
MTLALTANIILGVLVFTAVVAPLAWAIRISRPEPSERQLRPARQPRPATSRAAHARDGRSHGYGSVNRIEA